jgi:hypothetical protein
MNEQMKGNVKWSTCGCDLFMNTSQKNSYFKLLILDFYIVKVKQVDGKIILYCFK